MGTINVCNAVNPNICTMGSAVCQIQGPATSYSCGMASNFVISDYGGDVNDTICPGVRITYTNGDLCPALQTNRSTVLDIGCSVNNTGTVTSVTEGDACDYAAQMLAGAACGYIPGTSVTPSVSYSPIPTLLMLHLQAAVVLILGFGGLLVLLVLYSWLLLLQGQVSLSTRRREVLMTLWAITMIKFYQ